MSASPSSLPTPAPISSKRTPTSELADYEQESSGSAAEVPMDIDTEMEDGEIADDDSSGSSSVPPPVQPVPVRAGRPASRGVKRPHAEDLMDQPSRPASAARLAPSRRKIFCITTQRSVKLSLSLDDDSESESEDEAPAPVIVPPVIEIPPDWETVLRDRAIAEKDAHIRRLQENIAKLAAMKQASAQATPSGALTPATANSIAESAIKSTIGMPKAAELQDNLPASTSKPHAEEGESNQPADATEGLQDVLLRILTTQTRAWKSTSLVSSARLAATCDADEVTTESDSADAEGNVLTIFRFLTPSPTSDIDTERMFRTHSMLSNSSTSSLTADSLPIIPSLLQTTLNPPAMTLSSHSTGD